MRAPARERTGTAMNWTTRAQVLCCLVAFAACSNLLSVDQRGLITSEQINQQKIIGAVVAAAEGDYHVAFNWVAHSGAAAGGNSPSF